MRSRTELRTAEVLNTVRNLAKHFHSASLAQLASRIETVVKLGETDGNDPFEKIKGMISDLVAKLEKEVEDAAEEKAYCDDQMAKTKEKKDELEEDLEKLSAKGDKDAATSAGLKNEVKELENKVREAEMKRMKEVENAREAAEKEIEEYKAMVKREMANDQAKQKKSAQQQTLIDESAKIIEYLRKENMKLRNQNDTMRKDFKSLKENNARLMEANASASASFTALNDHAKQLNVTNAKLIKNVEAYKQQLEKLKDDLKTRQSYYLAEAEARLAYQKTMAQVVGIVQDKCKDAQLVEDVVIMALECEAEAKSERATLDVGGKKAPPTKAAPRKAAPAPAPAPDYDDDSDDDDSDDDSD